MDHQAHGLDLKHPIFHEPNEVTFEWTEAPREKQYEGLKSVLYPEGMGATFRLTNFEKASGYWNPTLVNHAGFFTDVPGFENLAEAHSGKVLGSLSLARQGRYFYWGYSIDPERMTAAAANTLVNVLHYMHRKRASLTVRFVCKPRQTLSTYLLLNRRTGYTRGIEEHLPGSLTPETRATYDPTPEGCAAWLEKHLPFVFSGKAEQHRGPKYKTIFEVDADAMALGTPNAERTSLERWMKLAATKGEDAERARRCLARYVHPEITPKDGDWKAWYARNRDRIVFIESTGFWWQEDPRVLEREMAKRER